jgi:hypothetical protein
MMDDRKVLIIEDNVVYEPKTIAKELSLEPKLNIDQARCAVAKVMCDVLAAEIDRQEEGDAHENIEVMLQAMRELHDSIFRAAVKFARPRILQPPRRMRIVR